MRIKSRLAALEAIQNKGKECSYAQFVIAARTGAKLANPPKKGSLMDYMMQKYTERMNRANPSPVTDLLAGGVIVQSASNTPADPV